MPSQHTPTQYLRVIGRLYPDRQLLLRPGYLTSNPPWSDRDGDSPLRAELFDEQDILLGSFPLRLTGYCLEGSPGNAAQAVRGFVPFHPRARRVVFAYHGQAVHELRRPESAPRAELTWQPADEVTGRQVITWAARHEQEAPLQYFLRYSHDAGQTWNRVSLRATDPELTLDFDQLPGGERCLLALVATDGINTTIVESPPFSVPRKPCRAFILHPLDGSVFHAGEPILLEGQGAWLETGQPEWQQLLWVTSPSDSAAAEGPRAEIRLPEGEHVIRLLAGPPEYQGQAEVRVTVRPQDPANSDKERSLQ